MTLPQKVQDAMKRAAANRKVVPVNTFGQELIVFLAVDYDTIRAELHRLTEIADSVDPLVIRLGEVTTRLEAANALLRSEAALLRAWARESREGGWSTHQVDPMNRRADEIDAHLQGSGDE